jgi:hypothetical protein
MQNSERWIPAFAGMTEKELDDKFEIRWCVTTHPTLGFGGFDDIVSTDMLKGFWNDCSN